MQQIPSELPYWRRFFPYLPGCGQTIRGELPDPAAPISSVLTPEQANAAAEALVRANEERQIADAAESPRGVRGQHLEPLDWARGKGVNTRG